MNYITTQEAAEKWGLTRRCVQLYCKGGRIPGAVNLGKQWMIPENAEKPLDTRLGENKQSKDEETYHFPVFVYSRCYLVISELSEDERLLRQAQLLNLKGEFSESVGICRRLIAATPSTSVRFGAWFTNFSNFMLSGLSSHMPACTAAMEEICDSEIVHKEDYRLLLAFLRHNYSFDVKPFLSIDVSKLSPDAITTYMVTSLGASYFSVEDVPEHSVRFFEAACRETDLLGIAPASLTMHCLIAMLHSRRGNMEGKLKHIEQSCRIGYEIGSVRLLAKCSSLDNDTFVGCLENIDKDFAADIRSRCLRYRSNWQLANKLHTGANIAVDASLFEQELVLLLIYKTPIEDIAILKNVTVKEVRNTIKELCARLGVKTKKELMDYFKTTFFSAPDAVNPMGVPVGTRDEG